MFSVKKIQESERMEILFFDIWILSTREEDAKYLGKIDPTDNEKKCCYWGGSKPTDLQLYKYLNGFMRYIKYDINKGETEILHAIGMYEG